MKGLTYRSLRLSKAFEDPGLFGTLNFLALPRGEFRREFLCPRGKYPMKRTRVTICYLKGRAIGVIYTLISTLYYQSADAKKFAQMPSVPYWIGVYVRPEYRRQGIGRALVRRVRNRLRRPLYLEWWDKVSLEFGSNTSVV